MTEPTAQASGPCCETSRAATACVFARALLACTAACECAERHSVGERDLIACNSPVAHTNCATLAALLHERARFALRLPPAGQPLVHAQLLKLHCGGLVGLQQALGAPQADVHRMVGQAHERHGSLTELPWDAIVQTIRQWQARRPRRPHTPPAP